MPSERFEPDAGAEPDVDRLRDALRELLGPADEYVEVFDPYSGPEVVPARLSDDLSDICADLLHGLAHHAAGRPLEALWWWQFSYLSTWGQGASAAAACAAVARGARPPRGADRRRGRRAVLIELDVQVLGRISHHPDATAPAILAPVGWPRPDRPVDQ